MIDKNEQILRQTIRQKWANKVDIQTKRQNKIEHYDRQTDR
jgi:hypothetical protein